MTEQPVRVLVVDDDPLVRAALAMIIEGSPGIELVGQAADGSELPRAIDDHAPDVVLMDIRMPQVDGLSATEELFRRRDPPEVIILTTFDADDDVLRALRAGANGFLLKDTPPAEIIRAIRRVAAGETILSPTIVRQVVDHATATEVAGQPPEDLRRGRARALIDRLSPREREVALAERRSRPPSSMTSSAAQVAAG